MDDFLERIDHVLTKDLEGNSLWEHLLANGYDIILLDYDDGGDYLERNSEFIKEGIRWVNLQKYSAGSKEKNIVIGQSMGGVCAMLALKEMEVVSMEDHEVGTYIVFDSPVMGVNVPLLGQASLIDIAFLPVNFGSGGVLADYVKALQNAVNLLYLPATRTMVKYFIEVEGISEDAHLYGDFYDHLHNELGGMPEQCEVITIANGSRFGNEGKHRFESGDLVFQSASTTIGVVQLLGSRAGRSGPDEPFDHIETVAAYSGLTLILFTTGTRVNTDIRGYAVSDMVDGVYYRSDIVVSTWWDISGSTFTPILYSKTLLSIDNIPGIDCAPGGFVGIGNQGLYIDTFDLGALAPIVFELETWCFTPTVSVLNFHGPYSDNRLHDPLHNFEDNQAEITSGNTRSVDNYVSNSTAPTFGGVSYDNTAHTWFTKENTKFLLYHLVGSDLMSGISNLNSGEIFNYGKSELSPLLDYSESSPRMTRSVLDNSLIVDNTYLAVNNNDNIGLSPSPFVDPDIPGTTPNTSSFLLNIGSVCEEDSPIILTIQNDGELILGDGNKRTGALHLHSGHSILVKEGGILRINKNSTLKIKMGGILNIEDGGTIIIEDGGQLITEISSHFLFHEGADIILRGNNALMDLSGDLNLFPNADFYPKHDGVDVSSGRIIWKKWARLSAGVDAKFQIIGDNKNDPMFTITEGGKIVASPDMALFRFSNCRVIFRSEQDYPIVCAAPFQSSGVTYEVQSNLVDIEHHPRIYLHDKALITNSSFDNVFLKVIHYDSYEGYLVRIHNSEFISTYNRDMTQFQIKYADFSMMLCDFSGFSGTALKSEARPNFSKILQTDFTSAGSPVGEAIMDASTGELLVKKSNFTSGLKGITKHYGQLSLKCNSFTDQNDWAIYGGGYSRIEMAAHYNMGYNVFTNIQMNNIKLDQAQFLSINHGYNYFSKNGTVFKTVQGTYMYAIPSSLSVLGQKNQWNPENALPWGQFDIRHYSSGTPVNYLFAYPQSASCGLMEVDVPIIEIPSGGSSMPTVDLTDGTSLSLDLAISKAIKASVLWDSLANDIVSIQLYHDILMHPYTVQESEDSLVQYFLHTAYQYMKHTVGHAISDSVILRTENQSSFSSPIQQYVDVLNSRSQEDTISLNNYIDRFYIELDKAELFRSLGYTQTGLDILQNTEICSLDSTEQITLNYWKLSYEEQIAREQSGIFAYGIDTLFTDTSTYNMPMSSQATEYYFGSIINSISSVTYKSCMGSSKPDKINNVLETSYPFKLYPNPSKGNITIEYDVPSESKSQLIIYSIDGKEISRINLKTNQHYRNIDISFVQNGTYLYQLRVDKELVKQGRVTIVH